MSRQGVCLLPFLSPALRMVFPAFPSSPHTPSLFIEVGVCWGGGVRTQVCVAPLTRTQFPFLAL